VAGTGAGKPQPRGDALVQALATMLSVIAQEPKSPLAVPVGLPSVSQVHVPPVQARA
jgi:hypothetical protein